MKINKMRFALGAMLTALLCACGADQPSTHQMPEALKNKLDDWDEIVAAARGQNIAFNAWGGSEVINAYIDWAGRELKTSYSITLEHIKVDDISLSISRILAEHTAGKREQGGSVDLMWINGENFRSMKENNLLFGPFVHALPNTRLVDLDKPSIAFDFGTPTQGYESPWGSAQMVLVYDSAHISTPPTSFAELVAHAEANPGRVTYPKPPNYLGTTFLKQALYAVTDNHKLLTSEVTDTAFNSLAPKLWSLIDRLHKVAWNGGASFPANGENLFRLLNDREVDFALSFSPGEASANIKEGKLPNSARTFVFDQGTIGNTHFLAIPANSSNKEAAMVAANFLLSVEAQLRKQHPDYWGDFTVLDIQKLDTQSATEFASLPLGVATLAPAELEPTLPEPHASWVHKLENAWRERYL